MLGRLKTLKDIFNENNRDREELKKKLKEKKVAIGNTDKKLIKKVNKK